MSTFLVLAGLLGLPAAADAVDQPISGHHLRMLAGANLERTRGVQLSSRDASIAAPFADPRDGSSLVLSADGAPGCRLEFDLPAKRWWATRDGDYTYRDFSGRRGRTRLVVLRPGLLWVATDLVRWPCAGGALASGLPLWVELRVGGDRYCALFGGETVVDEPGLFAASGAAAPAACPDVDLSVANLNVVHSCSGEGFCRMEERLDLVAQWVAASACPDVLTFQEMLHAPPNLVEVQLLQDRLDEVCPFDYERAFRSNTGLDEQVIYSRYPVITKQKRVLFGNFRSVTRARIEHPIGLVDVYSTHLASGSDAGSDPCGPSCPAECVDASAVTQRDCQAVQMALFIEETHDVDTPALATGDFNAPPDSFVYRQFSERGWIDTHREAGLPECDPETGIGCTSGRDSSLAELESPESNVSQRIDYIFVVPPGRRSTCRAIVDSPLDDDDDRVATRIFADDPNPFAACGPVPVAPCWPSDHEGNELDLDCH